MIEFAGEATESYCTVIDRMTGYTVRIDLSPDPEGGDYELLGTDLDADNWFIVRARPLDEHGAPVGPEQAIRLIDIHKIVVY